MLDTAYLNESIRHMIIDRTRTTTIVALMVAVLLGGYIRFLPALSTDFPINDGGLFDLMVQEVQQARDSLPAYTSYNGAHIPFAYPPFAFYLAAILSHVTNLSVLDMIRFLPPLVSTLTIPIFYLLSRRMLQTPAQAIYATFAFALLPRTFKWFIMGGGLTRAPGFLFAILTIYQAFLLYTKDEKRFILTTILCASLTILTHA